MFEPVFLKRFIASMEEKPIDFSLIELTDEQMPDDFHQGIKMIRRPYAVISEDVYNRIYQLTESHGDILKYKNIKMTFGNADGGWALMPLDNEHQDVVIF